MGRGNESIVGLLNIVEIYLILYAVLHKILLAAHSSCAMSEEWKRSPGPRHHQVLCIIHFGLYRHKNSHFHSAERVNKPKEM
jgi:hypothetical protein